MTKNDLFNLKRRLAGVSLKVKTSCGDTVIGYLASSDLERKLVSDLPFPVNTDDYIALIVEDELKASFLLASDVEIIETHR